MGYSFNPLVKKGFDEVGADPEDVLKIDQTTPQTITGGTPNLNLANISAPVSKADGFLSVVDDILWYFAGGHRYKLTATLDDPILVTEYLLLETGDFFLLETGDKLVLG